MRISMILACLLVVGFASSASAKRYRNSVSIYKLNSHGKRAGRYGVLRGMNEKLTPPMGLTKEHYGPKPHQVELRKSGERGPGSQDVSWVFDARSRKAKIAPWFGKKAIFPVLHHGSAKAINGAVPILQTGPLQKGSDARVTYYKVVNPPFITR